MPRAATVPTLLFSTLITAVLVAAGTAIAASRPPKVELGVTPLNEELAKLPFGRERTLVRSATYQYDLGKVVGHAIFLIKDSKNQCLATTGDTFDAIMVSPESYLQPNTKLEPTTVNKLLYDHKVSGGASGSLSVFVFAANLSNDRLAQLTVVDAASITAPDNSLLADWRARVLKDAASTGCPAILINGAKVRVATIRYYKSMAGNVNGALQSIFSANGQVYNEESQAETEVAIAFDGSIISGTPDHPNERRLTLADKILPTAVAVPKNGFALLTPANTAAMRARLNARRGFVNPR